MFDLSFESSPRSTAVRIRTRPLDMVYNRGWLAQLLKVIKPSPEVVEALALQASSNLAVATAAASNAMEKVRSVSEGSRQPVCLTARDGRKKVWEQRPDRLITWLCPPFLTQGGMLLADIEIAAPRIFVPLAESEDRGFLLLDTGHLSFKVRKKDRAPHSTPGAIHPPRQAVLTSSSVSLTSLPGRHIRI